jgi:hypothetical protein
MKFLPAFECAAVSPQPTFSPKLQSKHHTHTLKFITTYLCSLQEVVGGAQLLDARGVRMHTPRQQGCAAAAPRQPLQQHTAGAAALPEGLPGVLEGIPEAAWQQGA